jgi:hypothetical protein
MLVVLAGIGACGAPVVEAIPDGHVIAFVRVVSEGGLERDLLWAVDAEGRNETQISTVAPSSPGRRGTSQGSGWRS